MYGVAPYPAALGAFNPSSPARFSPGGRESYRLGDLTVTDEEHAAIMAANISAGVAVTGMASSALGGALIGGLASAKWSGAGTGALVSGGLAGLAGGTGAAMTAGAAGQSAAAGGLIAVGGVGLLGWGLWRWNKLRKGGR